MQFIVMFPFILLSFKLAADDWMVDPNTITKIKFGSLECEHHSNPTNARDYPKPLFKCFAAGKEKFSLHLGASELFPSPDNKFLLGLSNSGLHSHAFWVIDQKGQLILSRKHQNPGAADSIYCQSSITVIRKWYSNPRPEFLLKAGELQDLQITDCKNTKVSLFKLKQ